MAAGRDGLSAFFQQLRECPSRIHELALNLRKGNTQGECDFACRELSKINTHQDCPEPERHFSECIDDPCVVLPPRLVGLVRGRIGYFRRRAVLCSASSDDPDGHTEQGDAHGEVTLLATKHADNRFFNDHDLFWTTYTEQS